jgi:hypothetical protein
VKLFPVFLLLATLWAGVCSPVSIAFAGDRERPERFRNLPSQERRQTVDPFHQEQAMDPDKFRQPREEMRARRAERLKQADKNGDSAISREEAGQSMPHLSRHFEEVDANRDGRATKDEVKAFREKRMQQRLDRRRGDPRF